MRCFAFRSAAKNHATEVNLRRYTQIHSLLIDAAIFVSDSAQDIAMLTIRLSFCLLSPFLSHCECVQGSCRPEFDEMFRM